MHYKSLVFQYLLFDLRGFVQLMGNLKSITLVTY